MRVYVISPYRADTPEQLDVHVDYAQMAIRDCILRGEFPFASHLLYPGALNDEDPVERKMGIYAGHAFAMLCDLGVIYADLGTSSGMKDDIDFLELHNIPLEVRQLNWRPHGWPNTR